jgi:hypothetical protein
MMKVTQESLLNVKPRFGNDTPASEPEYSSFPDLDARLKDVVYLSANEKPPENDITRSQKKIRSGWITAAFAAGAALLGVLGLAGRAHYESLKPPAVVKEQYHDLLPKWDALVGLSRTVRDRDITRADENAFVARNQSLMKTLVETLEKHPNDGLNKELLANLRKAVSGSSDFLPEVEAGNIAMRLVNYIKKDTKLPPHPDDRQLRIHLAKLKTDFIDTTPAFDHLTEAEKQDLVKTITKVIKDTHENYADGLNPEEFTKPIAGYLGTGLAGVKLAEFKNIETKDDAQRLFTAILQNKDNFKGLSDSDRAAFLKFGNQKLESLGYRQPSGAYGLFTLLLVAGGLGLGGAAFVKRKELLGLRGALAELEKALDSAVLHIDNVDEADLENRRRVRRMDKEEIPAVTGKVAAVVQKVYEENKHVRAFLTEKEGFDSVAKLPDASWYRQRSEWNAVRAILKDRSRDEKLNQARLGQLVFLTKVLLESEAALETGDILEMEKMDKTASPVPGADLESQLRYLRSERRRIDAMINNAMRSYCNRMFGEAQAKIEFETAEALVTGQQGKFVDAGKKAKGAGGTGEDREDMLDVHSNLGSAKADLGLAKSKLEDYTDLAEGARLIFKEYVEPLRKYRGELTAAIDRGGYAKGREDQAGLRKDIGGIEEDTRLEAALHEQKIQEYLAKDEEDTRKAKERAQARIAKQLAELDAAQTPKAGSKGKDPA